MQSETLGRKLAEARRAGRKLSTYPAEKPAGTGDAFAVQEAMIRAMGVPVAGWKVGLTSVRAQALCGVDQPLAGPVFADALFDSGVELPLVEGDLGVLEAEIGFRMGTDLPPRPAPYGRDEVVPAIAAAVPVFEWVNKRLPGGLMEAPEWIIADGVINRLLVKGVDVGFRPEMDFATETVQVSKNGVPVTQGIGANALGDPLEVMVWLANDLRMRGKGLRTGEVVATGLISDVVEAEAGAEFEAVFGEIGAVRLRVL